MPRIALPLTRRESGRVRTEMLRLRYLGDMMCNCLAALRAVM